MQNDYKEKENENYNEETYPVILQVTDAMMLTLFGPLPPFYDNQVLSIYVPTYHSLKCMEKFVEDSEYVTIPPYYIPDRDAHWRGYHEKISQDTVLSAITNHIDNMPPKTLSFGPSEQFMRFVTMVCQSSNTNPSFPWYIAMVRWDERLSDLKLTLDEKDSKELGRIINWEFEK